MRWTVVKVTPTSTEQVATHWQECDALHDEATRNGDNEEPGTYYVAERSTAHPAVAHFQNQETP